MNTKRLLGLAIVGLFLLLFLFFVGCDSYESVSNGGQVTVTMMAKNGTSSNRFSSGRVAADSIVFTEALLGVAELELKALEEDDREDGECDSTNMHNDNDEGDDKEDNSGPGRHGDDDDDDGEDHDGDHHDGDHPDSLEVKFEGPFVFDLINGTSTPNFEVTPGLYKEIEFETAPVLDSGKSAFIAFEVTKGSEVFKVEFSTSAKVELEIEQDEGFQVDGGSLSQILVLLKLNVLFANIDFSQAEVDADGVIRINETSNTDLFRMIKGRFNKSFEAGEDDDHDGDIDED